MTIVDCKQAARLPLEDYTHDDDLERKIAAATEKFEAETDRPCIDQTFVHSLREFAEEIRLYKYPAHTIEQIEYLDSEGVSQTLDSGVYQISPGDNSVYLVSGQAWPSVMTGKNAVQITYVAGNGSVQSTVPLEYREAIIAQVLAWWDDPNFGEGYQKSYDRIKDQIAAAQIWG